MCSNSPVRAFALAAAAVVLCLPASAQPDYFPLQVGNQWIYRCSGFCREPVLQLEITRTAEFNGHFYSLLHGLPSGDHWLRRDQDGSLLAYDPDQNLETLWYAFQAPEGEVYRTSLPDTCCSLAMIASRNAEYRGPVGRFGSALEIRYPGVFQVGIGRELFLPYIGLIHRSQATGGPTYAIFDLIYSRTGGVTFVSEPGLTFGLTLDRAVYHVDRMPGPDPPSVPVMTARLTLRSTRRDPVLLVFPSGQNFDLVLRNESGDIVFRWSDGRFFTEIFRREKFGPGERNFALLVPLADREGNPLPPGKYVAEAWLATEPPGVYAASAGFEIQDVF
jgi:hypothetical protein